MKMRPTYLNFVQQYLPESDIYAMQQTLSGGVAQSPKDLIPGTRAERSFLL
jgi:hypothetical protein